MSIDNAYYTAAELRKSGFSAVGENVRVSRKCSLYSISGRMGGHVRIDDFCILKGVIEIGSFVHICAFCSISGVCGSVIIDDFATIANRVSIYTGSDDYRADALSSSAVPQKFVATIKGDVLLGRAAIIGAHSVILPNTKIGVAASIGALCIITGDVPPGTILVARGCKPVRRGARNVKRVMVLAEKVATDSKYK